MKDIDRCDKGFHDNSADSLYPLPAAVAEDDGHSPYIRPVLDFSFVAKPLKETRFVTQGSVDTRCQDAPKDGPDHTPDYHI